MSSPFQRPQGLGFSPSTVERLSSDNGTPFADGYLVQKRGTLRAFTISFSGMPTTGSPVELEIKDGASGSSIYKLPMYGNETGTVEVLIPFEIETGVHISGIGTMGTNEVVEGTFIIEDRDPAPADQEFPR